MIWLPAVRLVVAFASLLARTNLRCRVSWLLTLLCYTKQAQASTQQNRPHDSATCVHAMCFSFPWGRVSVVQNRPSRPAKLASCLYCSFCRLAFCTPASLNAPCYKTALLFSHCVAPVLVSIFWRLHVNSVQASQQSAIHLSP